MIKGGGVGYELLTDNTVHAKSHFFKWIIFIHDLKAIIIKSSKETSITCRTLLFLNELKTSEHTRSGKLPSVTKLTDAFKSIYTP